MGVAANAAVQTRWLNPRDYRTVCRIEKESETFRPWKRKDFFAVLRQRDFVGMVANHGRRVVGFVVYKLNPDSIELVKLGIPEKACGKGVERQLIEWLKRQLNPVGRTRLVLHVRESDLAAQKYLSTAGFRATRVIPGHFPDTGEDAYVMEFTRPPLA